ncbi:hypothetical protein F7725_001636, partial [Dissostichus mawsoni]
MDDSFEMEDDAEDLDFVLQTETESESDSECDPSDEHPTSTDFEPIQAFTVPDNTADERQFIVFESCIVNLFRKCQRTGCAAEVREFQRMLSGSRLIISTKCAAGCNYTWSSRPTLNIMGFYALQKRYLFPVINETWISCQIGVLDGLSREPKIVLSGDGRCDSPGHSAKYGTYSLMDVDTGLIVDFVVLNKADPSVKNSNAMEPMGLKQCLSNMKKWNISINIPTTDRHKTFRKILRVEFPEITHQFDLWHFCKSIIKKIIKACGKKKAFAPLLGWLQSISNHFWWCAESCQGNVEILKEKWDSILYHTANIHVWNDKKLFHACEHPPLGEEDRKKWVAKAVKVPKDHCYREDMMRDVVLMRTHGFEKSHVQLPEVNQNMFDIEKPEKSEV